MNLAIHVSAPRALRTPLRTVNEEAWQTFFTRCAGRAVKHGQHSVCAAAGPTWHPVLSMSGYPYRGWHDNSKKQCIIIDVTPCEAISTQKKKVVFESSSFRGMYYQGLLLLWWRVFSGVFLPFLRNSSARITFRVVLPYIQNF
jgi:hypothetical protein